MIDIAYDRQALSLTATGHANAGEKGQDIVCAAASILLYTLAANAQALGYAQVSMESGLARVALSPKSRSPEAAAAFDSVCRGFELLEESYPENLRFRAI